jgi:carbon storage regulator CsrA
MLVLTRKPGEQVVIPGIDLTVTVIAVHGREVRLGFTAPAVTVALRAELAAPGPEGEASHPDTPRQ